MVCCVRKQRRNGSSFAKLIKATPEVLYAVESARWEAQR